MRSHLILICFAIITIFPSCIREVPLNNIAGDTPLVISALLKPGNLTAMSFGSIQLFNNEAGSQIPDLISMDLYIDGVIQNPPLFTSSEATFWTSNLTDVEYRFSLTTSEGTFSSSTRIPPPVHIQEATYWKTEISTLFHENLTEASIVWQDPADIVNYYEVQVLYENKNPLSFYQFDQLDDPVIQQECDLSYTPSSFVFSDALFNGQSKDLRLHFGIGAGATGLQTAYVVLRNVSKEYYQFRKSWYRHIYLQNTYIDIEEGADISVTDTYAILFQGDPMPLYSNIENGIGIFAGYSEDIRKFREIK